MRNVQTNLAIGHARQDEGAGVVRSGLNCRVDWAKLFEVETLNLNDLDLRSYNGLLCRGEDSSQQSGPANTMHVENNTEHS